MKLALMQPYFFPYLSYFELISRADRFVFLDTVQYKKGGWINRNRIMKNGGSWRYLTVPLVKHSLLTKICNIEISDKQDWRQQMLTYLDFYWGKSPHYNQVQELFRDSIGVRETSLSKLNIHILENICSYIGICFNYEVFSSSKNIMQSPKRAMDWALNLAKALSVSEYINLPGGVNIYSEQDFLSAGIKLTLLNSPSLEYTCGEKVHIPNLSILDVLMWVPKEDVREYLLRGSSD